MANMTFGVNLLPKNDGNTYSLGNSSQKWKIYATEINGIDISSNTLLTNNDINLTSVEANKVFAGPINGSNTAPSFRSLIAADIPDLSGTYKTSSGVTGVSWNSSNKKIQQSIDNGTATDILEFEAGNNVTLTPTNGKLTIAATDTTYSNETAVSNGTDLSLVTTGEKYNWNNKGEKMALLSYGNSTWQDFISAYNNNSIVYCKASSNSNPASGAQTRMAFMAYVNANPPTNVEFQYYRSVNSHSVSTQGDQIYIYKLDSSGTWTVTVRNAYTKISAGTGIIQTYNNGELTLEINSQILNNSNDLDLITEVGFYEWSSNNQPLNTPQQDMAGCMVIYGKKTSSSSTSVAGIAQLITDGKSNIYMRMGTSKGWNDFVKYTPIDVNRVSTLEQKVLALEEESKPHIITDITDVSTEAGQTMSLTVEARNAEAYTWEYRPTESDAWRNPNSGYTSPTYSLKVAARHNGYQYRCKISNSIGYIYSGMAILTVT